MITIKIKFGIIGGFRGKRPPHPPFFFLFFENVLQFCFENRFIKCPLILSSETLTLFYFASRKRPQCCILHVLKSEVSIREGGGVRWGTRPPLSEFSASAPGNFIMLFANAVYNIFTGLLMLRIVFNVFSVMFAKTSRLFCCFCIRLFVSNYGLFRSVWCYAKPRC